MVVRDYKTEMPIVIPEKWQKFKDLLNSIRVQKFYVEYLTEFATKMQQVRKYPKEGENVLYYCDPFSSGFLSK